MVRTLRRREKSPAIFYLGKVKMNSLSVFVDEASNFGPYESHNPFYILTLVLHEQSKSIQPAVKRLEETLLNTAHIPGKAIHINPMIRQNEDYSNQSIDERRKQFFKFMAFIRQCDIRYKAFVFEKKKYDTLSLVGRMSRELSLFVRDNMEYFQSFDSVIVYYDGGQSEISKILTSVFNALLFDVDFRKVRPSDYYLFQAADLICTIELLAAKRDNKILSKSDKKFFYKPQEIKRHIKEVKTKAFSS